MQTRNTKKKLNEIKKGIVLGLLLTSFYGIGAYIYKTKIRIDKDLVKRFSKKKYKKINGHIYKWSEDQKSTFRIRNLGYEKRFSKTANLKELENGLKEEYCNAVKEIKKVDKEIVPGTNIPFKEATYIQVHDAYKEYLQKIVQIRQIFFNKIGGSKFENHIKCKYEDTKWNMDNYKYNSPDFKSEEIYNYFVPSDLKDDKNVD